MPRSRSLAELIGTSTPRSNPNPNPAPNQDSSQGLSAFQSGAPADAEGGSRIAQVISNLVTGGAVQTGQSEKGAAGGAAKQTAVNAGATATNQASTSPTEVSGVKRSSKVDPDSLLTPELGGPRRI